jgi:hypothetical protein
MQGDIVPGDAASLSNLLTDRVTKLVVNSGGGYAEEGLQIGRILLKKQIDVQVTGVCLSSCANYIFTVGKRKIIKDGVVGFHGNINALERTDIVAKEDAVLAVLLGQQSHHYQVIKDESEFFLSIGVSQALFDRTQSPDKGMNDGRTFCVLAPAPATFIKYGILGVEGDQSPEVIATELKDCAVLID